MLPALRRLPGRGTVEITVGERAKPSAMRHDALATGYAINDAVVVRGQACGLPVGIWGRRGQGSRHRDAPVKVAKQAGCAHGCDATQLGGPERGVATDGGDALCYASVVAVAVGRRSFGVPKLRPRWPAADRPPALLGLLHYHPMPVALLRTTTLIGDAEVGGPTSTAM